MTAAAMSIGEFRGYLAGQIGRAPESIPLDAALRTDADLDSIEMFLLVIAVEDLGVQFPEELLAQFMPAQYRRVRERSLTNDPDALLRAKVEEVLDDYLAASAHGG